jgi:hypothetical protein
MSVSSKIAKKGASKARERYQPGVIGHVQAYHPIIDDVIRWLKNGNKEKAAATGNTADVKAIIGKRTETYKNVPVCVYSQEIVQGGLEKNTRVWIEFINGDLQHPIITSVYYPPTAFDYITNAFTFGVARSFSGLHLFGG